MLRGPFNQCANTCTLIKHFERQAIVLNQQVQLQSFEWPFFVRPDDIRVHLKCNFLTRHFACCATFCYLWWLVKSHADIIPCGGVCFIFCVTLARFLNNAYVCVWPVPVTCLRHSSSGCCAFLEHVSSRERSAHPSIWLCIVLVNTRREGWHLQKSNMASPDLTKDDWSNVAMCKWCIE